MRGPAFASRNDVADRTRGWYGHAFAGGCLQDRVVFLHSLLEAFLEARFREKVGEACSHAEKEHDFLRWDAWLLPCAQPHFCSEAPAVLLRP